MFLRFIFLTQEKHGPAAFWEDSNNMVCLFRSQVPIYFCHSSVSVNTTVSQLGDRMAGLPKLQDS